MGAASAVLGALRANTGAGHKSVLACSTIENVGLVAIGIGLALVAPGIRSARPGRARARRRDAARPQSRRVQDTAVPTRGACSTARAAARSTSGGLIHRCRSPPAACWPAACGLAALPPGPGFASEWLLFQSLLAAPRVGGLAIQTAFAIAAALMALAAALAAAAAVRLIGVAFLGRPRYPARAGRDRSRRPARVAMIGLAALTGCSGCCPARCCCWPPRRCVA